MSTKHSQVHIFSAQEDYCKEIVKCKQIQWFSYDESSEDGIIKRHPSEVWVCYSFDNSKPWEKVKVVKNRFPGGPTHLHDAQIPLKPAKVT